jgi:hypothetical protein
MPLAAPSCSWRRRRRWCCGVTFEPGRSTLKPDSYTILDLVATSLNGNPDIKIEIGETHR